MEKKESHFCEMVDQAVELLVEVVVQLAIRSNQMERLQQAVHELALFGARKVPPSLAHTVGHGSGLNQASRAPLTALFASFFIFDFDGNKVTLLFIYF